MNFKEELKKFQNIVEEELQKYIGKRIREIRKNKHISQMELAFSIGMSMNTISYIESGKIASKIDTLNKIANELDVDVYDFFINGGNRQVKNDLNLLMAKQVQLLEMYNLETYQNSNHLLTLLLVILVLLLEMYIVQTYQHSKLLLVLSLVNQAQ